MPATLFSFQGPRFSKGAASFSLDLGCVAAFDPVDDVFDLVDRRVVLGNVSKDACLVRFAFQTTEGECPSFVDFASSNGFPDGRGKPVEPTRDRGFLGSQTVAFGQLLIAQVEDICLSEEVHLVGDVQQADLEVGLEGELSRTIVGDTPDDRRDGVVAEADAGLETPSADDQFVITVVSGTDDHRLDDAVSTDRVYQRLEVFVIHSPTEGQPAAVDLFGRNL